MLQEVQTEELKEEFLIARKDVIKTLKFKKYCSIATLTAATVLELRLLLIGKLAEPASQFLLLTFFLLCFGMAYMYLSTYLVTKKVLYKPLEYVTKRDVEILKIFQQYSKEAKP